MNMLNLKRQTGVREKLMLAALVFSLAFTARGQDLDNDSPFGTPLTQTKRFGISPFVGYRFGGDVEDKSTGNNYDFDDSSAFGLFLDYAPIGYYGRFELLWSHQDTSVDFEGDNGVGEVDVTIDVVQIGGVLEFGKERLCSYLSAHVGATHFSSDGYGDDTRFSFGIGVGGKAFVTKNLYLRADVRGFCTVVEADGSFISANGTTVASFNGSTFWQAQVSVGVGITF